MLISKFLRSVALSLTVFASLNCAMLSKIHAQYGASPSQTGLFFDDFRTRQLNEGKASAGTRDGDVSYDYESGVYRDNQESPMGQRMPDLETAREVSRPSVRSGSVAFAARSVGDYTNYSGQYSSPTGFFVPTYTSDPFLSGRRNLKIGPVNVGFGFFQGLEYNDNINRSNSEPISDVISTTLLSIDANYQITQNNRLSVSTALGFDRYFENPELAPWGSDGFVLNVLPGSTIAFDIKAGPVFFTLYNRFSVRPASRNDFALAQNQLFGVFQNDSGLAANWRINSDWTLALNYMHSFTQSMSDANSNPGGGFDEFNRVTDSLHGSLTYSPSGTWTVGIEGGSTSAAYETDFNADGILNNMGVFAVIPIGKTTYLRAAAGAQIFDFETLPRSDKKPGINPFDGDLESPDQIRTNTGDQSDLSDYYYSLTLSNRLNSRITQSVTVGHESSLNLTSNYITADYANYGLSLVAWRGSRISLSGYVENAKASGGFFAQDFFQYGGDLYISHRLSSNLQVGAGYHYGFSNPESQPQSDSAATNDFTQQAFNIDLIYALSPKANLSFGYRYYTTEVDNDKGLLDFDQNRLILGFNYNF